MALCGSTDGQQWARLDAAICSDLLWKRRPQELTFMVWLKKVSCSEKEVIGHPLKVPVISIVHEAAANHFAWFERFVAIDVPAASQKTRELLGWKPKQPVIQAVLPTMYNSTNTILEMIFSNLA